MTAIRKLNCATLALVLVILVAGTSCAGYQPPAEPQAQSSPTEGVLPAAVLGTASPLAGQSVSYFAGDDATVGGLPGSFVVVHPPLKIGGGTVSVLVDSVLLRF